MHNFDDSRQWVLDFLTDFELPGIDDWKKLIDKELKGKAIESLISQDANAITTLPYYHAPDTTLAPQKITTASFDVQEFKIIPPIWVDFTFENITVKNKDSKFLPLLEQIQDAQKDGINNFALFFSEKLNIAQINQFLEQSKPLQADFFGYFNQNQFIKLNQKPIAYPIELCYDPFVFKEIYKMNTKKITESDSTIWIDTTYVHEFGGSVSTELLVGLRSCALQLIKQKKSTSLPQKIKWAISVDAQYFTQIAKLRLARILIQDFLEQTQSNSPISIEIYTHNSLRGYTTIDIYNNLLRATTAAAASIIGGANGITIFPHDYLLRHSGNDAQRWARNICQLLQKESYFNTFKLAADGNYYISELCNQMYQKINHFLHSSSKQANPYSMFEAYPYQLFEEDRKRREINLMEKRHVIINVNKFEGSEYIQKIDSNKFSRFGKHFTSYAFFSDEEVYFKMKKLHTYLNHHNA